MLLLVCFFKQEDVFHGENNIFVSEAGFDLQLQGYLVHFKDHPGEEERGGELLANILLSHFEQLTVQLGSSMGVITCEILPHHSSPEPNTECFC